MTLLSWMAGCVEPPASPAPEPLLVQQPAATVQDVSSWQYDAEQQELPPVDLLALEDALQVAADSALTWSASPVIEAYAGVLAASATPACPPITEDGQGNSYWQAYCEGNDGTTFNGYLSNFRYDDTYDPYSDLILTGSVLTGNVALQGAMGVLDLEGQASFITGSSSDGSLQVVSSSLAGGFWADGALSMGWLASLDGAASLSMSLFAYTMPALGGVVVGADGSTVSGDHAVIFRGVQVGNQAIGSSCEAEPGGSVEMRDPYGRWVDILFHGPQVEIGGGDPLLCDGCGEVTLDGEPVGQVCPDFTSWYQWEMLP